MDRRQSPRIEVQLPVRVWGMDAHGQPFTHPGLVINMSIGGIVIQGVRRKLRTGEVLDVQMGEDKAQFRVIWASGEGYGEIGLQRVTSHTFVSHSVLSYCAQAAASC